MNGLNDTIKETIEKALPDVTVHSYEQLKYLYLCESCHDKLLALDAELWQFTISSLVPEPCHFCGELTRDFYEPRLILRGMVDETVNAPQSGGRMSRDNV